MEFQCKRSIWKCVKYASHKTFTHSICHQLYTGHLINHLGRTNSVLLRKRRIEIVRATTKAISYVMTLSKGHINSSVIAIASQNEKHHLFIDIGHWSDWCDSFKFFLSLICLHLIQLFSSLTSSNSALNSIKFNECELERKMKLWWLVTEARKVSKWIRLHLIV